MIAPAVFVSAVGAQFFAGFFTAVLLLMVASQMSQPPSDKDD